MKTILLVCAVMLANCLASCSVYMEATRPSAVDLNDYRPGIYRDAVVKRLGPPDSTVAESQGASCDRYELCTHGYGTGGKITFASLEGTVDLLTIGLAEIVLTPTESLTKNKKYPVVFCYRGDVLARVTDESRLTVGEHQSASDDAAPTQTDSALGAATPVESSNLAAVAIPTSNPQVDAQWTSSELPQ